MTEGSLFGLDTAAHAAAVEPMQSHNDPGTENDVSVAHLARIIAAVTSFAGRMRFDPARPDGTPRKPMNVERLQSMGWQGKIGLREGIEATYDCLLANQHRMREIQAGETRRHLE